MMAKFDLFGKLGKAFNGAIRGLQGNDIRITKRIIMVDGKIITDEAEGVIELKITEGVVNNVDVGMDLTCGEIRGNAEAGMSVKCGNIGGDVEAGMDVNAGDIAGNAEAGMSLTARDIGGKATAGMSVKANSVGSKKDAFSK